MPRGRRHANIGRNTRHNRNVQNHRQNESEENHADRLSQQRDRTRSRSQNRPININSVNLNGAAFQYNPQLDYSSHKYVVIGSMDKICGFCQALKFKTETPGMCCAAGKVRLPDIQYPPEPLATLLSGTSPDSKHFLEKISTYNSCFQMTSFGAGKIITDNFMPTFKVIHKLQRSTTFADTSNESLDFMDTNYGFFQIQGQAYHLIGSLLPLPDQESKFLQIYFINDNDDELEARCAFSRNINRVIMRELQDLLHTHNVLVQSFKTTIERLSSDNHKIKIDANKTPAGEHRGRYNQPTSSNEVAIVISGDEFQPRDIVLQRRNDTLQRVNETHRKYDALQYPLMFCRGEDGYSIDIKQINPANGQETNKTVSAMNYYAYRIMIRENQENHILKCRKLFHQYIVDMYAKIETERLNYIRFNQRKLRCDEYIHLRDAINNDTNVNNIGQMVILPSSYTGSPRHMHEYAQDAMCYVRNYGRPDLFITFTCNPKWDDIKNHLYTGQSATDRHDITARVFRRKLQSLMDFIVKHKVYGDVQCFMYSVEWQKRGLPHAHILIWLKQKLTTDKIDHIICAEIPDINEDPELHTTVTKNMIHGPCGTLNQNSPCMVDGKCSKNYPRQLIAETMTGNDGYPLYRRRSPEDNGKTVTVKINNQDVEIDNRWIVPYSKLLSKTFNAHINVEYCNSVKSIKYICKYINKGSDMAVFGVVNRNDEITNYQMGRYISSNEAVWRILSFPIHDRHPAVIHLSVHLENEQSVYFTENTAQQMAERPPATTLTAFFNLCETDSFARTLLYSNVPKYYTWNASSRSWVRRQRGIPVDGYPGVHLGDAIGRLYTVHPSKVECFYLRLLLVDIPGPRSFESLKRVNGHLCCTYQQACKELNLLENDNQWDATLMDACATSSPHQIRTLFAIIIATCFPANPKELWSTYQEYMTEDILHQVRRITANPNLNYTDELYNEALIKIEDFCLMIANKTLNELGMIAPNRPMHDAYNAELRREKEYDRNDLNTFVTTNLAKLNTEQRQAYDTIIDNVANERGGIFFLDAPGGTGKTFLLSLILATIRSQNNIALALASSGIAATLLDGGRTAHSALKLPLNMQVNEEPTCNISKNSGMGKVLQTCKIIVWDECTMAHKKSLEALNRTLKDFRNNTNIFGGALILLAGDFRQTLPVIPKSTAADELRACLKSSNLWRYVQKLTLTTNVRVQLQNDPTAAEFSEHLLQIGNGRKPIDKNTGMITLPTNFCTVTESRVQLVQNVFPNIAQNYRNQDWLSERAILAAKNVDVNEINASILTQIPGEVVTYKSIDSITNPDDVVNYPIEFLNSLNLPGLPPHRLQLKVGAVIIMLRNINQPKLCNGTRLAVKRTMNNVIEATILKGKFKGEDVLIPRIPMISTDLPFDFKRLQFPIRLAFAITINKSQGQTLQLCGIDLTYPCFGHGQLYVGCSRVGKPSLLYIYTPHENKTKNFVYQKALE